MKSGLITIQANDLKGIHARPCAIIAKISSMFADGSATRAFITRKVSDGVESEEFAETTSIMNLMLLVLRNGDQVLLETHGRDEDILFNVLEVAFSSFGGDLKEDEIENHVFKQIDKFFVQSLSGDSGLTLANQFADAVKQAHVYVRYVAKTNVSLSRLLLLSLIKICRSAGAEISIAFGCGEEGIYVYDLNRGDEYTLLMDLWQHLPGEATQITIIARNDLSIEWAGLLAGIIENSLDAEDWLKRIHLERMGEDRVTEVIAFAKESFTYGAKQPVRALPRPITTILPLERLFWFHENVKEADVLKKLAGSHAIRCGLSTPQVEIRLRAVGAVTVWPPSLSYYHCQIPNGPRIEASLAYMPHVGHKPPSLILVVVTSPDTTSSKARFMSDLAYMLYNNEGIIDALVNAKNPETAFEFLRAAEESIPRR